MIKSFKHISTKTKLLIFTLVLIILPSSILALLGFRSIEDIGLRLKENYQGMARLMRERMEDDLLELEATFLQDMSTKIWNNDIQTLMVKLNQIQDQYAFISDVFLMDSEGRVIHPYVTLGVKASLPPGQGQTSGIIDRLITQGERYEFVEKDYLNAIHFYKQAAEQTSSRQMRSFISLFVARCYSKKKNYLKAKETYLELCENSKNLQTPNGTPIHIIGLSQLSETYGALGQQKDEYRTLLKLYEELISTSGEFESYDFQLQAVKEALSRISQNQNLEEKELVRLSELEEQERQQSERIDYLQLVQRNLLPRLNPSPAASNALTTLKSNTPLSHIAQDSNGTSYQIRYMILSSSDGKKTSRILAYQIDKKFVLTELLSNLEKKGASQDNVQIGIFSQEESLVPPTEASSPERTLAFESFSEFFPWWKLVLFDKDGKTVELLVRKEKQVSLPTSRTS
jgi:tetratricopeptide (TPR) repeat protein